MDSDRELIRLLQDAISRGALFRFAVKGTSMSPSIRDQDTVTIAPMPETPIGLGTLVAYVGADAGTLVIHRVIGKTKNAYLIKGDNAYVADGLIPAGNILGFVSAIERNNRKVFFGLGIERLAVAVLNWINFFPIIFRIRRFIFLCRPS